MSMHALILNRYNGPLEYSTLPCPEPAAGQVLVRIAASGLNPLDTKIRAGAAAHAKHPLPLVLGIDLAGTVTALGAGVTGFSVGDKVYGMAGGVGGIQGSLAEYAAVDADLLGHVPRNLSMREAAALPLAFTTSYAGIVDRAHLQAGARVLVQGGSGGVGHIAVQLAHALGAEVYATASAHHGELVRQLGATPIDYRAHHGEMMRAATRLVESGNLAPVVDPRRFDLRTAEQAYELVASGTARTKVVVEVEQAVHRTSAS
jgi:NADPH2:quinone reductase